VLLVRLGGGLRETGVPLLLLLLRDPSRDDEVRAVMLLHVTAVRGKFLVPWDTGPVAICTILALGASTACGLVLGPV
jgi:hypothetical protein